MCIRDRVRLEEVPEAQHVDARRMLLIDGPLCEAGFTWWQVQSDFYSIAAGWVAELDGDGQVNLSPESE